VTSGPVDWDRLLSSLLHPTQVLILDAVDWIDVPAGPRDLVQVLDGKVHIDNLSYHFRRLGDLGILEAVGQEQVRGALAKFWIPTP
jgi:DNA-binding transcriptional ArsR family regulator